LSGFKEPMPPSEAVTKTTAHLPGLEIEIAHRQSPDGLAEQISINLRAVPSFEALSRLMDVFNPFAFWAEAARLAWFPWVEATRAAMRPSRPPSLPKIGRHNADDGDQND
jgi:hypothetical protein